MELIRKEDALRAITKNLDRINGTPEGAMYGVAKIWLKDVETVEHDEMGS